MGSSQQKSDQFFRNIEAIITASELRDENAALRKSLEETHKKLRVERRLNAALRQTFSDLECISSNSQQLSPDALVLARLLSAEDETTASVIHRYVRILAEERKIIF